MKYYNEIQSDVNFADIELEILDYWKKNNVFKTSVRSRNSVTKDSPEAQLKPCKEFVFYDGPPFANGLPHYGHLLTGFIKDTFARYQTMSGKNVERRFGWDCHGLPAEIAAEKDLNISGRLEIEKFGIDKFNEHCKSAVMKFSSQWKKYVTRQARWVDFDNDYKTMEISFMESTIWAFKELYKKGLVYESIKVVPYSWACETPLSNFETRLDNSYRKKESKAVTVKFKLKDITKKLEDILAQCIKQYNMNVSISSALKYKENIQENCFLLVWTTTPWTLPSNLMIAINKSIKYKAIIKDNEIHIAGAFYFKNEKGTEISSEDLIGSSYDPLFEYFRDRENAFYVTDAKFVTEDDGTGIVHIAPGFGEDDFELCKRLGVKVICPVDNAGKFTEEVKDFKGMNVFEANDKIIQFLKTQKNIIKIEQYFHNYPHCWRTDTPLIYKAVSSWYIEVTKLKDKMLRLNQSVKWYPQHIKDGLFGNWLEGARDWAISRNRFFGTPIPIWKSDDPAFPRVDVYGSIADIERDFSVQITDLHKPFIDTLVRKNPDDPTGKSLMRRVTDVFDCWFESGSMPFAQVHYPFENKEWFENNFPADFITEYIAQTRGWFYTLFVISTGIFEKAPFKNCICHGVVLDESGQKLSKKLNNYPDPLEVFDKYGADSLRLVMLSSGVMQGGNLLLDKDGVMLRDAIKLIIKPIWNTINFFITYANLSEIKAEYDETSDDLMDKYIINKSKEKIIAIKNAFEEYDTTLVCKNIIDFIEILNNWYIRRNRERFLKDVDKQTAFNTLFSVCVNFTKAIAPTIPLIAEKIWQLLGKESSVHLQYFPNLLCDLDHKLTKVIDKIREICNVSLSLRNKYNIRIRQPLQMVKISTSYDLQDFAYIIKEEVNVKEVLFEKEKSLTFILKLNLPLIGKRYPKKIKPLSILIKTKKWHKNQDNTLDLGEFTLLQDEYMLVPESKDQYSEVLPSGDGLVYLDINITEELKIEGLARDMVRFIQQTRKEANLKILDLVNVGIDTTDKEYIKSIELWNEYIKKNTSSNEISVCNIDNYLFSSKINDKLRIAIQPV